MMFGYMYLQIYLYLPVVNTLSAHTNIHINRHILTLLTHKYRYPYLHVHTQIRTNAQHDCVDENQG